MSRELRGAPIEPGLVSFQSFSRPPKPSGVLLECDLLLETLKPAPDQWRSAPLQLFGLPG